MPLPRATKRSVYLQNRQRSVSLEPARHQGRHLGLILIGWKAIYSASANAEQTRWPFLELHRTRIDDASTRRDEALRTTRSAKRDDSLEAGSHSNTCGKAGAEARRMRAACNPYQPALDYELADLTSMDPPMAAAATGASGRQRSMGGVDKVSAAPSSAAQLAITGSSKVFAEK